MKVFQECFIIAEDIETAVNKLSNKFSKVGYDVEYAENAGLNTLTFSKQGISIFLNTKELKVINILDSNVRYIDMDRYNELLREFGKIIKSIGFEVQLSKDEITIEERLSLESAKAFLAFSSLANKSTGRSHPCDEMRWFEFLYSMIKNDMGNELSYDEIKAFLLEQGWMENIACELARDMEYGLSAMKYAKGKL